jgi:flagellar biosynthesis protein FlhA
LSHRVFGRQERLMGNPTTAASTILLCSSPARFHLRPVLEPFLLRLVVLSPAGISAQSFGVVR